MARLAYPVYLAHLFFLGPLREWIPAARGMRDPAAILVPWAARLLLSIALVYLGRALLGLARPQLARSLSRP